jgi:hypothetical protein
MGRQPVVVVADPDLCREVGIKKFKSLVDRSTPASFRSSPIHYKSLLLTKYVFIKKMLPSTLSKRNNQVRTIIRQLFFRW